MDLGISSYYNYLVLMGLFQILNLLTFYKTIKSVRRGTVNPLNVYHAAYRVPLRETPLL